MDPRASGQTRGGTRKDPTPTQRLGRRTNPFPLCSNQPHSLAGGLRRRFFSSVTLINKSYLDVLARHLLHLMHQVSHLCPLLLVGRRHFQGQEMAEGVDHRMHFGSFFALVSIVARAVATLGRGLQSASVQDDRRRLRRSPRHDPEHLAQIVRHGFKATGLIQRWAC